MKHWFKLSLSARLLSVFITTALAAVILLAILFNRGLGSQWHRAIAPHLRQYVAYIREDIGMPPDEAKARALADRLPVDIQVHLQNEMLFTTRDTPLAVEQLRFFRTGKFRRPEHTNRSTRHTIAFNEDNNHPVLRLRRDQYTLYVEMEPPKGRGRGLDEMLYAIVLLTLLLALCYWVIRRLLAPIGRLQQTVQAISDGNLSARTNETGTNDLTQLANSVDTMTSRIQKMLDAKRDLLLAISHELRSPLTRARVAAELVEESGFQRKVISNIDEMERLIGQLVESERLSEHAILHCQNLDINSLIDEVVESLSSGMGTNNDRTHSVFNTKTDKAASILSDINNSANIVWNKPHSACVIEADKTRLCVLIRNLLMNALTHGIPPQGNDALVKITQRNDSTSVTLCVQDNGPGIATKHLEDITDAFYRPDESRTRNTGGFGLGLHLCLRIAEAHGGTLNIDSPAENGLGTAVTVRLPKLQPVK